MKPHRRQPLYLAFLLHRLSGLGLALFLPFHFYVLGLALQLLRSRGRDDRFDVIVLGGGAAGCTTALAAADAGATVAVISKCELW